mmetsp:Transcript_200/g.632  ORF Transcript_200/g.632 Transcript_200/m.632 type:complete len:264 (+) Transcript_200:135-926(+)
MGRCGQLEGNSMSNLVEALEKAIVKLRRKRVSRRLFARNGGEVRYGPFKGLKLSTGAHTSAGNLGAKTCGLYEDGVIAQIMAMGPYQDVVNFGAGDGYFSLGVLVAGIAERSICFELNATGREVVDRNAQINGLSDRVLIFGAADDETGPTLAGVGFDPSRALVLCDIDGGEFPVLTEKLLGDLRGATLIVELHDKLIEGGETLRQELIDRLPEGAQHRILKSAPPQWQDIPEIEEMTDYDRALAVTDGRKLLGEWLIVTYDS